MRRNPNRMLSIALSVIAFFFLGLAMIACDQGGGGNNGCGTTPTDPTDPSTDPSTDPGNISYDSVVAKDGSGKYSTVQAAINAAPSNRNSWFTIYIKNGKYREVVTVPADKTYLRLVGESNTGTVLTYGNSASSAGGTGNSASVFLKAKNFIAKNITFENSFDYNNSTVSNKQAVAAEPMADRQVFVNCRFTGYQDTLYVRSTGRNYFKNCFIQGHTDFIFGDATAVFDGCLINSRDKNGGCISAPSTLSSTKYGLVFLNCDLTGNSTGVWLGRPWHPSSSTQTVRSFAAYVYCDLGAHIARNGWTSMNNTQPATERFYEYGNTGPGAAVNSARPQLSASQAAQYTVKNILGGSDNWDPEAWANM